MKIATVSMVVGDYSCNARCPFCVASQTYAVKYEKTISDADIRIGCRLGELGGATTCLITGKGEPTLYPEEITTSINIAKDYFPLIELQTNGIRLPLLHEHLPVWYRLGLRTISLSTTHYEHEANKKIYGNKYLDIAEVKKILDSHNIRLRISVVMHRDGIDTLEKCKAMIDYCRKLSVTGKYPVQLTMRPVACWDNQSKASEWTKNHMVSDNELSNFYEWISKFPIILTVPPDGKVLDIDGQNLCVTDCLTTSKSTEELRQIIIYPDGRVAYDWKYKGAFLI
ncbi:MAG: radical SAM protein [Synergistaceae bacterium]